MLFTLQSGIPNHRAALYKEIRQSFRQHINEKDPKKVRRRGMHVGRTMSRSCALQTCFA